MPDLFLIGLFLFLIFAPCLIAFDCATAEDGPFRGALYLDQWKRPRSRGRAPAPLQAALPEVELAEDFQIRSFAKGISQRRLLVRDTDSGVKLTIAQVRAAAVELVKLGGRAVAHDLALVAAATAATMTRVADALSIAAQEALAAARNASAWFAWADVLAEEGVSSGEWDAAPPVSAQASMSHRRVVKPVWLEAAQAA